MIHNLNVFREKHRDRIVRKFRNSWFDLIGLIHLKRLFTWFVVAASIGMMFLLGYTISLFIDYATTAQGFLATECLEVSFIIIIVMSVLLLITITRGTVSRGDRSSRLSSKVSTSNKSTKSKSVKDTFSPSPDVSGREMSSTPPQQGTTGSSGEDNHIKSGTITI